MSSNSLNTGTKSVNQNINNQFNSLVENIKITPKIQEILNDIRDNQKKIKELTENKTRILKEYSSYIDKIS